MYGPRAHNVTVEGLAQLIMGGSVRIDAACAARVLATIMEGHIEVGDASHYIYHFARKQGWDIPAYPLAGFTDLLHSGLIEKMSARPDTTQTLERLTDRILAFELHGDTGGLPAF